MTLWVGTSFKMNKTRAESREFAETLAAAIEANPDRWPGVQPFVIPSFTAIATVARALQHTHVIVGAQDAHWDDAGAWTGSVSVPQLADAGARLIEIGHSERREFFAETDETVRLKIVATLRHGLTPLLCVGEPDNVFNAGGSTDYILAQVEAALHGLTPKQRAEVIVAYEPIWAIGENGRPAAPWDIAAAFETINEHFGSEVKALLYGGSVNQANAATTLGVPHVDGLFVGRSAWNVTGYLELLDIAARYIQGPKASYSAGDCT